MTRSKRCYLVCSTVALGNRPGVTVSHYLGSTKRAAIERLADHVACGLNHAPHAPGELCSYGAARLTAAMVRAGGVLTITRIWAADNKQTEKKIKAYGKLHQLCPACNTRAMKHTPKGLRKGRKING